jgi:hypothetical protein
MALPVNDFPVGLKQPKLPVTQDSRSHHLAPPRAAPEVPHTNSLAGCGQFRVLSKPSLQVLVV